MILIKKIIQEITNVTQTTGIDIEKMPKQDLDRWVSKLVRKYYWD